MRKSRLLRHIALGVKTLMLHKLRSFLTVLGVVFGVGSVIAMLSVGEGASKEALDQIRKLGSNNIIIRSIKPPEDEQVPTRSSFMSVYGLLYDDANRIGNTMPAVKTTVPVKSFRKEGRLGERTMQIRVMGVTPAWFDLLKRQLVAGRRLSWQDVNNWAAVCVLTETGRGNSWRPRAPSASRSTSAGTCSRWWASSRPSTSAA